MKLWSEERDRAARLAKMAIDAGLAEKQVRLAERQGQIIAQIFTTVLDDDNLGLLREQRDAGRSPSCEASSSSRTVVAVPWPLSLSLGVPAHAWRPNVVFRELSMRTSAPLHVQSAHLPTSGHLQSIAGKLPAPGLRRCAQ